MLRIVPIFVPNTSRVVALALFLDILKILNNLEALDTDCKRKYGLQLTTFDHFVILFPHIT